MVASERIGAAAWEEVPEGGFVGTEDGRRAMRGALCLTSRRVSRHSSPAIGKPRGNRTS